MGYDDGCHYHAYTTNPITANATPEAKVLVKQTIIIDSCHLKGHTDAKCRERFNPKKDPLAKDLNTQVASKPLVGLLSLSAWDWKATGYLL